MKTTIEDSYYRMKHGGSHYIRVENVIDVQSLVVHLELDRVKFLRKVSPSGLLYCIECETALADVLNFVGLVVFSWGAAYFSSARQRSTRTLEIRAAESCRAERLRAQELYSRSTPMHMKISSRRGEIV